MKTLETQKAELLDWFMGYYNSPVYSSNGILQKVCEMAAKHDKIVSATPLSSNPYVDEVMSGRLLKIMNGHFRFIRAGSNHQISECPNISDLIGAKGFGPKMQQEYIDLMRRYGFNDKID